MNRISERPKDLYLDPTEYDLSVSRRDWFAGLAMQAMITSETVAMNDGTPNFDVNRWGEFWKYLPQNAFGIADRMIKESEKEK